MSVRVVGAREASALDAHAVAHGIPARELMRVAGEGAALLLLERFPLEAERGVAVFTGAGNNGGDGWVLAAALARRGVRVRVFEAAPPLTPDAIVAREQASPVLTHAGPDGTEGVIVDALLGIGAHGSPRGPVAAGIERITACGNAPAERRPRVVALDVPSGLDATTGAAADLCVRADLTITFGTVKRGLLMNRDHAGAIAVLDIGLNPDAAESNAPILADAAFVANVVPRISANAHKGTRKRLLIVGGAVGMAGAVALASRAARRSGIGMVRLCVHRDSLSAVQALEPTATAAAWPETDGEREALTQWADVLLVGPGLGADARAQALAEALMASTRVPLVLDADGLRLCRGNVDQLRDVIGGRPAVLTPHAAECARLAARTVPEIRAEWFEIGAELARAVGAVVLLKGTPTVASDGVRSIISASGTPVLAAAGSGDILAGIVATLLVQCVAGGHDALRAAAASAWIHGRAAEIAAGPHVRGVVLEDVLDGLRLAWSSPGAPRSANVLTELVRVGDYAEHA